jgi:hypothetical protein
VIGNLALLPGFVTLVQPTPADGVAQWTFATGSFFPTQLLLQALWVQLAVYLGGTGDLYLN